MKNEHIEILIAFVCIIAIAIVIGLTAPNPQAAFQNFIIIINTMTYFEVVRMSARQKR